LVSTLGIQFSFGISVGLGGICISCMVAYRGMDVFGWWAPSLSAFQKLILPNHKFSLTTAFSSTDILSLLDVSFLLFAYQFLFRFTMDLLLSGSVVLIMLTL